MPPERCLATGERHSTMLPMETATRSDIPARIAASIVAWIIFWLIGLVLFPIAFVLWIVTVAFDRNLFYQHLFTSCWVTLYVWLHPGWKLRIDGRERLPWNGPAILVANHQSQVDPLVAFALFRPFKPVTKAVVRWIPLFGWNMMMNRYI